MELLTRSKEKICEKRTTAVSLGNKVNQHCRFQIHHFRHPQTNLRNHRQNVECAELLVTKYRELKEILETSLTTRPRPKPCKH